MRDGFKMPKVSMGDVVLWRHNRVSPEPAPAVVTAVGDRAISLSIVVPGSVRLVPKDGVRYDSDPEIDRVLNESGVWSYTEGTMRWAEHEAAINHLTSVADRKAK